MCKYISKYNLQKKCLSLGFEDNNLFASATLATAPNPSTIDPSHTHFKLAILNADENQIGVDMILRWLANGHEVAFCSQVSIIQFNLFDNKFPLLTDFDAYIGTGSHYDTHQETEISWINSYKAWLKAFYFAGASKLFSICFGHQMGGVALGGTVMLNKEGWGTGLREMKLDMPSKLGLPSSQNSIIIPAYHRYQVAVAPESAALVATSPFCPNEILAYGKHMLTMQTHPEKLTAKVQQEIADLNEHHQLTHKQYQLAEKTLARVNQGLDLLPGILRFLGLPAN
jgi:GMP synthase-like glutamine amidotransferase